MPPEAWPARRPAAIAWDLDGTLVDSAADLCAALNVLLAARGLKPRSLEAVRDMIGHGVAMLIQRGLAAAGEGVSGQAASACVPEFLRYYRQTAVERTRPYDGVLGMLNHMAESGIPQAVCTNKPEAISRHILERLGMDHFFYRVTGGDSTPRRKPDPLPLESCLGAAGVELEHCLMVGDSATDVATARAAGVPVAVVAWGYSRESPHDLGADYVLEMQTLKLPAW